MSNKHLEAAERRLYNGTNNEVARAAVEATLALAYEQRTANMIELFAKVGGPDQMGLASTISERLGLK